MNEQNPKWNEPIDHGQLRVLRAFNDMMDLLPFFGALLADDANLEEDVGTMTPPERRRPYRGRSS